MIVAERRRALLLSVAFQKNEQTCKIIWKLSLTIIKQNKNWNMKGRITKVSSAALAIAGAPVGLSIISTGGGITPVVLATISVISVAKMVKNSIQRKG